MVNEFSEHIYNNTKKLSIERIENNVHRVRCHNLHKEIVIVGTAHISHESARLVKTTIELESPKAVAIELCESRYKTLQEPERWKEMDIFTVIREGKAYLLLSQLILAAFQRKIGKNLAIKPGLEMLIAAQCAQERGIPVILADREIKITFKRLWRMLSWLDITKIIYSGVSSFNAASTVTTEQIEELKKEELLDEVLNEFGKEFPKIKEYLINERDRFIGSKLINTPYSKMVVVVGAGHVPGIINYLQNPSNTEELSFIPSPALFSKIIKWLVPITLTIILVLSFRSGTMNEVVWSWITVTSISGCIGGIVALAHPFTIIISGLVAPFTAINPLLRSGWISALVELILRKPQVRDMETILDDVTSLAGWYRNRVTHSLLIMISVNLFCLLGSVLAIALAVKR